MESFAELQPPGPRRGPLLIFAGTATQARLHADREGLPSKDYRYVSSEAWLRGRATRGQARVFLASFYDRHDYREIRASLAIADHTG